MSGNWLRKKVVLTGLDGLVLALLVLLAAMPAMAVEKTQQMDEIVVSASRVEEKVAELTTNVTVINADEIRQSAADNLGDLLAEKGIGHIQKYPGNLTSIGIRGFRTASLGNDLLGHVLILLNGRRAGTGNVDKIMTKNIERIEIIRGPAAVQYGSAAMGGLVNVITRRGDGKPGIFLEGSLGSYNYQEGSLGFSGSFGLFDFSGSYTSEDSDEYDIGGGDRFDNTDYKKDNLSLNVGINFLPGHRLGVIYSSFDADHSGNPNYISSIDLDDYTDNKNESIDINYEGRTKGEMFSWMARYFNGKDDNEWYSPAASDPNGFDAWGFYSFQKTDFEGAQVQMTAALQFVTLTGGFDWAHYEMDSFYTPESTEYNNPAGFILAKSTFLDDRLILTAGVRYDDYKLKVDDDDSEESDDNLLFNFGIAYWLNESLKIRANYGEAFMMPSADQLAANRPDGSGILQGNSNLDPESSQTYEAGLDFYYQPLTLSLTCFHTDFDDKIQKVSLTGGISSWDNIGSADITGIEGNITLDIGSLIKLPTILEVYGNFVYLPEFEDENNDDLLYISDWNLSYGLKLPDWQGFAARLNFAYTGKQDVEDWESGWPAPVVRKGGFTVADLTMSKKVVDTDKYGDLTLRGEIRNIFDKEYSYVKGYPMPGRTFQVGLRYDF
ncbi:MAG: TonB-dependent receptor [Xanthomonadaceae bacterium]|nr:TonB-dependent receptor [Xanthomonadaceae bacterium]